MTVWRGKYEQWRVVDERHRQSDAVRMELLELGEKADEKRSAFLNKLAMNTQRQRAEHESVRGAGARKRAAVQAEKAKAVAVSKARLAAGESARKRYTTALSIWGQQRRAHEEAQKARVAHEKAMLTHKNKLAATQISSQRAVRKAELEKEAEAVLAKKHETVMRVHKETGKETLKESADLFAGFRKAAAASVREEEDKLKTERKENKAAHLVKAKQRINDANTTNDSMRDNAKAMKEERRVQAQQMRGALQMYELNDVYLQLSKQKGAEAARDRIINERLVTGPEAESVHNSVWALLGEVPTPAQTASKVGLTSSTSSIGGGGGVPMAKISLGKPPVAKRQASPPPPPPPPAAAARTTSSNVQRPITGIFSAAAKATTKPATTPPPEIKAPPAPKSPKGSKKGGLLLTGNSARSLSA